MADKTFIADSETQDLILAKTETINTNVDSVNSNVGAVKTDVATINSRTTTLQTTLNTVNANVNTLVAGRAVKSIQRGRAAFTNSGNVAISSVNVSKSFLIIDFIGGPITARIASSVQVEFLLGGTSANVDWQVIEFY